MDLEERFWSKVNVGKKNECWEWVGAIDTPGYGAFKFDGKKYNSHRIAWYLTHSDFPNELVLHKCDNRLCCNPKHLFLGTYLDNAQDMVSKGRHGAKKGSESPLWKPIVHGTDSGYINKKCRCQKCKEAHAKQRRIDRQKARSKSPRSSIG